MILKSLLKSIYLNLCLFFDFPFYQFGTRIWAPKEEYLKLYNDEKIKKYKEIDLFLNDYDHQINKDWLDNLALHTQVFIKENPLNYQHGRILYSILMKYIADKKKFNEKIQILETGTSRGFSSIVMSKAIEDSNVIGQINTIDIIKHDLKMIWNCIDDHEGKKTRSELLEPWKKYLKNINFINGKSKKILSDLNMNQVNFAFLDAIHKFKELEIEFKYVYKRQKKGDMIFFDDVTPGIFDEVVEFINYIKKNYPYKVVHLQSSKFRGYAIAHKL